MAHENVVKRYPELFEIISPVLSLLDNTTIQDLNYRVDALGKPAKVVAHEFLMEKKLVNSFIKNN